MRALRVPFSIVMVAALMVLGACGSDDGAVSAAGGNGGDGNGDDGDAPDAPSLDGEYRSVAVTEGDAPRPLVGDSVIAIRFDGGTFSANAGCNTLGGDFRIEGTTFFTEEIAQTEMGCDAELMDQDAWLTDFLRSRPTLTLDPSATGDTAPLVLAGPATGEASETVISFVTRETAEPDVDLVGTTWLVTGFIDGDSASSPAQDPGLPDDGTPDAEAQDRRARVEFDPNGLVVGHDGCNGFGYGANAGEAPEGLAYAVDGDVADGTAVITFTGSAVSTSMACTDVDTAPFWMVLSGTVTAEIEGSSLTLTASDGRGVTYRAEATGP